MILSPVLRQRFFDANGVPLAGGQLFSYIAGSSTPQVTYSNSTGTTNTNPVVLDSNGYADVWIDPTLAYKFVLEDASNNVLWTVDNVKGNLIVGPTGIKTTAYTILASDGLVRGDASGGTFAFTFPASPIAGQTVELMKVDSSLTAITFTSGPSTGQLSTQNEYRKYLYTGSVWQLTAWNADVEPTAYTPSNQGQGTPTSVTAEWERKGGMCIVRGRATTGTVGGSNIQIGLPVGSISSSVQAIRVFGRLYRVANVASNQYAIIGNGGDTAMTVGGPILTAGSNTGANTLTAQVGNSVFNNSETFTYEFTVPINSWGP